MFRISLATNWPTICLNLGENVLSCIDNVAYYKQLIVDLTLPWMLVFCACMYVLCDLVFVTINLCMVILSMVMYVKE